MQPLLSLTETLEFEEYGGIRLLSVEFPERGARIRLRVWPGDLSDQNRWADWEIETPQAFDVRLEMGRIDRLSLKDDHFLLSAFRAGTADLAFHGRPDAPSAVVAAMLSAHWQVAGNWIPFGKGLNGLGPIELLATGGGILATGPRALIDAYAEVLDRFGLEPSLLPGPRQGRMDAVPRDLSVLLLDSSYVIGAGFAARELARGAG